jgi:hypothetical protein
VEKLEADWNRYRNSTFGKVLAFGFAGPGA